MIDVAAELMTIEAAAKAAGTPMRAIFRRAQITPSNWGRWKSGTSPTIRKWEAVHQAARELIPSFNEANSPASGDTARRDASASPGPKPEIVRSLSGVRSLGGGGA